LDVFHCCWFRHGAGGSAGVRQTHGHGKREVCKDADGNPIVQGEVEWTSSETGHKYDLKTNKKGRSTSRSCISPGKYNVVLKKDGKELFTSTASWSVWTKPRSGHRLEERTSGRSPGQGLTPEQAKARQEANSKAEADKKVCGHA